MKGRSVDQLVFEQIFNKGVRPQDPQNFHALLQRYLILEVRQEVHSFYGHLDTQEAKYPGLDYSNKTHRIRLSRWPWHRRLFRAFDALGLTRAEIAGLTKWEGTKWAKERFEREQGITIPDTTAECMGVWIEPEDRPEYSESGRDSSRADTVECEDDDDEMATATESNTTEAEESPILLPSGDDSDEELESVGEALNERLRLRVALRNASGDTSMPLDEEWENWLKNAIESGQLGRVTAQIARNSIASSRYGGELFPPRMMAAARAGRWNEIPDFLHDMIRHALEREGAGPGAANNTRTSVTGVSSTQSHVEASTTPSASRALPSMDYIRGYSRSGGSALLIADLLEERRTYSSLRLPGDGGSRTSTTQTEPIRIQRTRTAAQPGA